MSSEENVNKISRNSSNSSCDSKIENELLSEYYKIRNQGIKDKELPGEKAEDVFSDLHPVVTAKNKVINLLIGIDGKQLKSPNSGTSSKRSAFSSSLDSINSIIENEKWIPKVLYVVKPNPVSDNNFEVLSNEFHSDKLNILKPPIPSEWGTEKTELSESERLKNLSSLLHTKQKIPPSDSKKKKIIKIGIRSKIKKSNKSLQSSEPFDASFNPENEFLELNSRYPPAKKLEKSKSNPRYEDTNKNKSENLEFFADPDDQKLSNTSSDSFVTSSREFSISDDEDIIKPSKKTHDFKEKPIVRPAPHFIKIEHKRISKPYGPYEPQNFTPDLNKKSSLKTDSSLLDKNKKFIKSRHQRSKDEKQDLKTREIHEPQPGTSKMEIDYEFPRPDASEVEKEKIKIENPFSNFSLQGVKLQTLGFEVEPQKVKKVRISDTTKISKEKLGFSSENKFQVKSNQDNPKLEEDFIKVSNDQDPAGNEVELDKSLKEFSERKEETCLNVLKNNVIEEEDDTLVFSWSSSDLGITRWSLPSTASMVSNSIVDRLSFNYIVNSVVKRFMDVRQLAPIISCQRPTTNLPDYEQIEQVEPQEASVSHLHS